MKIYIFQNVFVHFGNMKGLNYDHSKICEFQGESQPQLHNNRFVSKERILCLWMDLWMGLSRLFLGDGSGWVEFVQLRFFE